MAEHQRLDLTLFRDFPDIQGGRVGGDDVVIERPGGLSLLDPLEGGFDPEVVDDLMDQDVGALGQFLEVSPGVGAGVARDDQRPVIGVEAEGKGGVDLVMIDQGGGDAHQIVLVDLERVHGRAGFGCRPGLVRIRRDEAGRPGDGLGVADLPDVQDLGKIRVALVPGAIIERLGKGLQQQMGHLPGARRGGDLRGIGAVRFDDRAAIAGAVFFQPSPVAGTDDRQRVRSAQAGPGADFQKRGIIPQMIHMQVRKKDRLHVREEAGQFELRLFAVDRDEIPPVEGFGQPSGGAEAQVDDVQGVPDHERLRGAGPVRARPPCHAARCAQQDQPGIEIPRAAIFFDA